MSNHELSASIAASLANTPEPGLSLENSLNPKNLTVEANFPARFFIEISVNLATAEKLLGFGIALLLIGCHNLVH